MCLPLCLGIVPLRQKIRLMFAIRVRSLLDVVRITLYAVRIRSHRTHAALDADYFYECLDVAWSVCASVSVFLTRVSAAKMAELVDMPFRGHSNTGVRSGNNLGLLDGVRTHGATWSFDFTSVARNLGNR